MSNTKHTPTPWERCDAFGASATGRSVKAACDDKMICSTTGYYGRDGAAANAAFIVRACNSHEQLVAALRNLIAASDAYSTMHAPDSDDAARMVRYAEAFNNARAALAATEAA